MNVKLLQITSFVLISALCSVPKMVIGQSAVDIGTRVIVITSDGSTFEGILIAANDSEITIETEYGMVTISRNKIKSVAYNRVEEKGEQDLSRDSEPKKSNEHISEKSNYELAIGVGITTATIYAFSDHLSSFEILKDEYNEIDGVSASLNSNEEKIRWMVSLGLLKKTDDVGNMLSSVGGYVQYISSKGGDIWFSVDDDSSKVGITETKISVRDYIVVGGLVFNTRERHPPGSIGLVKVGIAYYRAESDASISTIPLPGYNDNTYSRDDTIIESWFAQFDLLYGYQLTANERGVLGILVGGGYIKHLDTDWGDWYLSAALNFDIPLRSRTKPPTSGF